MQLVDYTHPGYIPHLHLPLDRRSPGYYLRLDELPYGHPYYSRAWALFRHPEWLEGGSAWLQAYFIAEDLLKLAAEKDIRSELRPVVGSADPEYDEALAQALITLGLRPKVAEVWPEHKPEESLEE